MSVEYSDLKSLIFQNCDARQYYNELPKDVREQLGSRSSNITSYESLQDYVKNLLKDDD